MKTPPTVVCTGLTRAIGSPEEYSRNLQTNSFPEHYDLRIPTDHLTESKKKRVRGQSADSVGDALECMSLSPSKSKEEVKAQLARENSNLNFAKAGTVR